MDHLASFRCSCRTNAASPLNILLAAANFRSVTTPCHISTETESEFGVKCVAIRKLNVVSQQVGIQPHRKCATGSIDHLSGDNLRRHGFALVAPVCD